jgi:hypothetical protein
MARKIKAAMRRRPAKHNLLCIRNRINSLAVFFISFLSLKFYEPVPKHEQVLTGCAKALIYSIENALLAFAVNASFSKWTALTHEADSPYCAAIRSRTISPMISTGRSYWAVRKAHRISFSVT